MADEAVKRCKRGHIKDGVLSSGRRYCKTCSNERSNAWARANREKRNAAQRRRRTTRPEVRETKSRSDLNGRLKRQLGITLDEAREMLEAQGGVCAICDRKIRFMAGNTRSAACVDHDHGTGRIRGILCHPCNCALGFLADDPRRLARAQDYLLSYERMESTG